MPQPNDLSRSPIALNQDGTLIAVIEMSQSSWLVTGVIPGIDRHPLKKLEPDEEGLLRLLRRWQDATVKPTTTGPAGGAVGSSAFLVGPGGTTSWPTRSVLFRTVPAFCAPLSGSSSDKRAATLPKGARAANLVVT